MRTFRNFSIKHKLTAIIMLTSTIVLLLASGAFVANALVTFRRSMIENLSTLAEVIGTNSTASLAFNDQDSANETLAALEAEPHITSACIYTKDGKIFARYTGNSVDRGSVPPKSKRDEHHLSDSNSEPPILIEEGHHFQDDHLDLFKQIVLDGDTIGTVYLQSDLYRLYSRLRWYAIICAIVMLTSIFVAYLLSSKFQRLVSKPILHLVQAMKVVSEEKSYSIRVRKQSNDELGILIDGFNEMLSQIHVRDREHQRHREHLEERVAMLTAELSQANQHLEQAKVATEVASKAKGEFLANMTHEIRTPLNPIIGMTSLALNMELTPSLRKYLTTIQTSAHALVGIINDVLDFSKIEEGKLEMEIVDFQLHDVLENLCDMFRDKVAEKEIELIIAVDDDVPCALIGDPLRLGQVLINLTSNALKFTDGGEVLIRVVCLDKSQDKASLRFLVKDTGIGITQEHIPKLFSAFTQADGSATRKYGGTGLGLTICKWLVEMMEGEIWVESELGEGSTFLFTAHFDRQAADREQKLVAPSGIQRLKVLVVDDNKHSRIVTGKILKSFTFEVDTASSGEEGLEKLRESLTGEKPFELVLMDWKMPGLDGIAASKEIKEDPQLAHIPIILTTGFGREEEMRQGEAVGVDAFLIRPLKQSLLFDTIMYLFGQKKSEETAQGYRAVASQSLIVERLTGARILMVEDNDINREVASEILANAGIIVETANNGKEAVEAVNRASYDCVLMDVQMPEMDGFEATRVIRRNEEQLRATSYSTHIPIIAMTAHAMKGDREKCIEAGMDDYVAKPIDPEALFSKLSKWIKPGKRQTGLGLLIDHHGGNEVEEDVPPILPGINIEEGLRRLGGNKKLFKKLLKAFSTEFTGAVEEIRNALNDQDMEVAHRLVHNLKGVGGNISTKDVRAAAQELNMAIKEGASEKYDVLLRNLEKALSQVLESIRAIEQGADEQVGG
jgi:two-component system sensor histidine kinase/response regulator